MVREESEDKRSNYGLKTYTPEETKNQWIEEVARQLVIHRTHSSSKLERCAIDNAKESSGASISYFNNNKQHSLMSAYDRQFHAEKGFHSKLKRDDRTHALGLNVNSEERCKDVPILSSSAYGHRAPIEKPARKYCRVGLVQRDFYRDCGTNIPDVNNDCKL